jgi:uncharacterized protein
MNQPAAAAIDELTAPLGQNKSPRRPLALGRFVPWAIAGVLGLWLLVFVSWAALVHDPLGGEPMTVVAIDARPASSAKQTASAREAVAQSEIQPATPAPQTLPAAPAGQTITIIDGSSGKRQEVQVAASTAAARPPVIDPHLLEASRHGQIPRIGADGARPSDVYAQPVRGGVKPDSPRVALIVGGLGIGTGATAEALAKLPGPVTFAFAPYGNDLDRLTSRARGEGHEVLLQVPMEPFDYPDNDPGPQTLLTSLSAEQNIDRLQWLMSRFQGYVGIANYMGARFTASDPALAPILRETAKRGLIYVDDGSAPRSLATQIAGANSMPFAKADVVLDAVPTPAEVDRALARLEGIARERGNAVGVAMALPVSIERIAAWAKAAADRGLVLVPVTAVIAKPKAS